MGGGGNLNWTAAIIPDIQSSFNLFVNVILICVQESNNQWD
jgi:hypothetical protein